MQNVQLVRPGIGERDLDSDLVDVSHEKIPLSARSVGSLGCVPPQPSLLTLTI
jgi:hypothetical protein